MTGPVTQSVLSRLPEATSSASMPQVKPPRSFRSHQTPVQFGGHIHGLLFTSPLWQSSHHFFEGMEMVFPLEQGELSLEVDKVRYSVNPDRAIVLLKLITGNSKSATAELVDKLISAGFTHEFSTQEGVDSVPVFMRRHLNLGLPEEVFDV